MVLLIYFWEDTMDFKNKKIKIETLPDNTKFDETLEIGNKTYKRLGNRLYNDKNEYVSGIDSDLLTDKELDEIKNEPIPKELKALFES